MTTDITELAQSLKAAAEKATPGRIGDRIDGSGSIKYQCFGNDGSLVLQTDHKNMEYGFIGPNAEADELFFRECAPANILALVEALEKSEKTSEARLEAIDRTYNMFVRERDRANAAEEALEKAQTERDEFRSRLKLERSILEDADKRIADLEESHTQAIQSRDHYKRMSEEGLKKLAESRTVTVKLPEVRITVAESRRRNMTWRELEAYNEGADVAAERIGKELTAQGIKWEAE
ncbi:ead/Ea22-like family protein [Klebsiella aerogenes]|uniref:ead/Ea22-like family protein n=1 Tax=Klebsiella aerogenes TaxID=548 RepID=UPI001E5EF547|nr:ead/Ea22-like family protein [Klebsiella aerogenes]